MYTIPDDTAAAKVVKIRCARCGAVVVVGGGPPPATKPIPVQAKQETVPPPTSPSPPKASSPKPPAAPSPRVPARRRRAVVRRDAKAELPRYRPRNVVASRADMVAALPFVPRVAREPGKANFEVPIEFNFDSHYDVLGVSRHASAEEIKRAAFDLFGICDRRARKGDEAATQRLQKVNEAQDVLGKPDKRRSYDREPEAMFLTIQDPFPYERLSWNEGLDLIKELVMTGTERDPVRELEATIDDADRPNAILDELLGL